MLLSDTDTAAKLLELNRGASSPWGLEPNNKLHKKFVFDNFVEAFGFMLSIADYAETVNHHPEWHNVYNWVEVWLTTHDAGGITDKDFSMALEMEKAAGQTA